jgi:hypothetical protein
VVIGRAASKALIVESAGVLASQLVDLGSLCRAFGEIVGDAQGEPPFMFGQIDDVTERQALGDELALTALTYLQTGPPDCSLSGEHLEPLSIGRQGLAIASLSCSPSSTTVPLWGWWWRPTRRVGAWPR